MNKRHLLSALLCLQSYDVIQFSKPQMVMFAGTHTKLPLEKYKSHLTLCSGMVAIAAKLAAGHVAAENSCIACN